MMLDEKDLQAIAGLMKEEIGASESRMTARMKEEIGASESRMTARMKEEIGASESRMTARMKEEIGASESRTTAQIKEEIGASESRMMAMMEAYFEPKFDLLAEQMRLIQEKLLPSEAVEDLEDRMDVAEAAIKQHSREIAQLKRAQ